MRKEPGLFHHPSAGLFACALGCVIRILVLPYGLPGLLWALLAVVALFFITLSIHILIIIRK